MSDRTEGTGALKREGRFSAADYRTWPEDERWELIEGTAYAMSPAPRKSHQDLVRDLLVELSAYFQDRPCTPLVAPLDVYWTDDPEAPADAVDTITQPDLMVVCDESKLNEEGVRGAPDFIIEITSPSTMWRDHNEKRLTCERYGVHEYWLVNPKMLEVTIYRRDDATGRFGLPTVASLVDGVEVGLFEGLVLSAGRHKR